MMDSTPAEIDAEVSSIMAGPHQPMPPFVREPEAPAAEQSFTPRYAGDIDFTGGIPQSGDVDLSTFGESPWDAAQAAADAAEAARQRDAQARIDQVALDPENYFRDKDLSFTRDPKKSQMMAVNSAFLEFASGDQPVALGESDINRRLLRQDVALRRFNGRGADSEEAFHAEVVREAQGRKDGKALAQDLNVAAFDDAMLPGDQAPGYGAFREKMKTHAGYDPAREADYAEAFYQVRREAAERVDEFREPLVNVWRAFKAEGSVTGAAFDAWQKLTPEQRPDFLDALAIRAKALPEDERKTFWANMGNQTGLALEDYGRNAAEGARGYMGESVGTPAGPVRVVDAQAAAAEKKRFNEVRNFAADVRRISREDYDPLKSAFGDGGKPGFWEGVAYQVPAVTGISLSMAVPGVGAGVMLASMEGAAYESMRGRMMAGGLDDATATANATALAPFVALPQAALEKAGFAIWSRKMPGFSKVMDTLGDKIANRALRFGAKVGTIGVAETGIELTQDAMNYTVQDIAAALNEDVPDVDWGKELSGTWATAPEIFAVMLPLAILGAAGGLSAESRHAAFKASSTAEKQALGMTAEGIAGIEGARGPASLATAINSAMETRDPNSPEAAAAVETIKGQLATTRQAQESLERLGYAAPSFVTSAAGITVFDGDGTELGTAPDLSGAVRIARAHTVALDDLEADQVAALGSMMEAAKAAVELDPQSTVDISLGQFDPEQATPEMAARFAAQVALKEQAEGGTGDIARSVLGYSATEMAQGVRNTVNRLFQGAAVTDVFHETFHGLRRQALAAGTITRADEIALLRSLDTIFAGKTTKAGVQLRFIPDGMLDGDISTTLLDEAIAEIAEMEVLRTRKGQGKGKLGVRRSVVSRNLTALSKLMPGVAGKWKAFIAAVRARWGLSLSRAVAMKKAERDGKFEKEGYEAFLDKLLGLDAQQEHDAGVVSEFDRILGLPDELADDDIPFSIGSYERLDGSGRTGGIDTNTPGGANIGDGAQPGNSAVTPEMDVAYLDAATSGKLGQAQRLVDDAARSAGFHQGPVWHGSPTKKRFSQFDAAKLGTNTEAGSAKQAFFFADRELEATEYSLIKRFGDTEFDPDPDNKLDDLFRKVEELNETADVLEEDEPELAEKIRAEAEQTQEELLDYADEIRWAKIEATKAKARGEVYRLFLAGNFKEIEYNSNFRVETFSSNINQAFKEGFDGVHFAKVKDTSQSIEQDAIRFHDVYAVKNPTQIAFADAVLLDSSGNVIPLSQRFNQSPPADSGEFSLGPADVAGIMSGNALARITDPRRRTQVMSRIARDFDSMRLQMARIAALAGVRRTKGDLRREARAREDMRAEELIADIHRRYGSLMADDDLVKIKSQPVHAALADPTSPLRGRVKSKAAAMRDHPDLYQLHRAGDYDGSDGVSRSVFGGQRMPDQAAQELYDSGLIPEPTADALWEALLSEQKSVAGMKELLAKATAEIRQAKADAKKEATEWLETQGKDQETSYSGKEEVRRSLRMLDAILLALPAEIRGKIGGYTQISMIASDDARLAYLQDKLAKADTELETYLRVEYAKEWDALLKKAAPATNNPGERPTGSIAADAYDIFRVAQAAMGMNFAEGEAEADKWDAIAEHADTDLKDAELARVKAQMVRLTMNWSTADAARREQAVLEGEKIYYDGLLALRVEASRRRERLADLRKSAITGTGKTGHATEIKDANRKTRGSNAREARQMAWEFLSFGQVVNVLFGEKSAAAKWMNAKELAASNAFEDAFQAKANAIEELFTSLSGSRFGGEQLRHKMATVDTIKVRDALGVEHLFTDSEAITFLLMWRQEDGQRHMRGLIDDATGAVLSEWAWDDASAAEIEAQLSTQGKAAMAFLGQSYGEEYGRINEVFRRIWNVSMPRHKMYSPLSVAPAQGGGDTIMDPASGETMGAGMTPGSLKNRSFSAVAKPQMKDAFQVYLQHARQMEHFIAYGEFARDAIAVVNRREARDAIEASGGPDAAMVLSGWLDYFAQGGLKNAKLGGPSDRVIGKVIGRLSQAALVGRVSVLAMQSLQLTAAAYQMPVGAFLTRLAKLNMGMLSWGDAVNSDYIKRRIAIMPPIVRDAVQGLAAGRPNRAKYAAAELGKTISGADALFTGGTYAIFYDYHLKLAKQAGMANPEAHAHAEAERLTDQVAQPVRMGARSWVEVRTQGNPAFRAMWNFSSDPRQKVALAVYAALRRDKKGAEKAAALGKALTITWIGSGILAALLRAAMRDIRSDEDDEWFDERHWSPKRLGRMALTGPLGGMPYLGEVIENTSYKLTGEYMPAGGMLAGIGGSLSIVPKWLEGDFDVLKDAEKIFTDGAAVSSTSGAMASAMHILRDAWGIIENIEGPE